MARKMKYMRQGHPAMSENVRDALDWLRRNQGMLADPDELREFDFWLTAQLVEMVPDIIAALAAKGTGDADRG